MDKPTHQIVNAGALLVLPARGAWRVRKFDPKTPMKLVKSESGWALVAREGRPLSYVGVRDMAPVQ